MAASDDKFYKARVLQREDIANDLWKVRLDPGGDFKFVAGQYATLGVHNGEKMVERAYSIVSSPYEKELEIFIELVPEGALTPMLYQLQVGHELSMRKAAKGRFTLDTKSGRKNHLLLCTVTGIAPFISYMRTLACDWKTKQFTGDHRLYIINGASRSWEFGYRDEIAKIAAEVPWLTYIATVSRPWEDANWHGETGRVDDLIRKYSDEWRLSSANTTAYLCGHPQMVENGEGILKRCGYGKEHIKTEVYWIPQ
jgi:ferredoxin/flavodoxin---NADP+ reductase